MSDANKKVLVESGYLDIVLHMLCTMFHNEDAAMSLSMKLATGLDMATFKMNFPHEPSYVSNPDALRLCLQLIVELSFSSKVVQRLHQLKEVLDPMLKLVSQCDSEKRIEVLNLLQKLNFILGIDGSLDNDTGEEQKGHVMISYAWKQQSAVKVFAEELKRQGYIVWIDLDYMAGDTVETMATAVENSSAVIMCASQAYKESHNCRLEAMYANQLKKPIIPLKMEEYKPDGWLGLLMGVKLYYDGTRPKDAAIEVDQKELHSLAKTSLISSGKSQEINLVSVDCWDNTHVMKWVQSIGFESYSSTFQSFDIDGKALLELKHMRNTDPVGFQSYIKCKDNFCFDFKSALVFGQE